MNFHILAKKNFGPGVAYSEFTTVRTHQGGGKGVQKAGKYSNDSTDRLREKRTRGGRGSKMPENLRTYFMDAPLRNIRCGSSISIDFAYS